MQIHPEHAVTEHEIYGAFVPHMGVDHSVRGTEPSGPARVSMAFGMCH